MSRKAGQIIARSERMVYQLTARFPCQEFVWGVEPRIAESFHEWRRDIADSILNT